MHVKKPAKPAKKLSIKKTTVKRVAAKPGSNHRLSQIHSASDPGCDPSKTC